MVPPVSRHSLPALRPLACERTRWQGRDGIVLRDPLELAEPCFLPRPVLAILRRLDGDHSAAEIANAASRDLRQPIAVGEVEDLVRELDEHLLLASERYECARDEAVRTWLANGVREAAHAGSAGYAADTIALRASMRATLGPVTRTNSLSPRGLVAPHVDLLRGDRGYAAAYGSLAAFEPADLYVVFGTGHQGPTAPVTGLPLDWRTPLGTCPTDRAFVANVHAAVGASSPEDLLLHRREHSLEFQVLWLQFAHEVRGLPPPRIAGFLTGSLPSADGDPFAEPFCERLLAAFRTAEKATPGRVCYVAGADLAHVGPFFDDDAPVSDDRAAALERADLARLAPLWRGEPGAFHREVDGCGNPDRVCSAPAIALTAALAGGPGHLLNYGQALADDRSQVVTFAAATFAGDDAVRLNARADVPPPP